MRIEDTRMYRVKEVAGHFNVSVSTIYRAIASGQLGAVKLGTAVRVPGAALLLVDREPATGVTPPRLSVSHRS